MALSKICGIETEWSICLPDRQDKTGDSREFHLFLKVIRELFALPFISSALAWEFSSEEAKKYFERAKILQEMVENGGFLPNGARLYVDYPHLEYSTPECLTVKDLVACEWAGNRILQIAAQKVSQILNEDVRVFKDNSDRKGNSYGSHENYLLDRVTFVKLTENFEDFQGKIIPFLISRQILAGAGKIGVETGRSAGNAIFQISQRADFVTEVCGLETTANRNLINTRDEPHANRDKFARLHVILGDANLCEWSLYLRMGTMAIVLKMLEDNFITNPPVVANPVKALQKISRDPDCKALIELADGRKMTAIDLQEWYLERAHEYLLQHGASDEEKDILNKWSFVLTNLRQSPLNLFGYLDWITKRFIIERKCEKDRLTLNDSQIKLIDILYHDLTPSSGIYCKLLAANKIQRIIDDSMIEKFVNNPPENTRAYLRGMIAKRWPNIIYDWESILYENRKTSIQSLTISEFMSIILENPLLSKEEAEVLLKRIESLIGGENHGVQ